MQEYKQKKHIPKGDNNLLSATVPIQTISTIQHLIAYPNDSFQALHNVISNAPKYVAGKINYVQNQNELEKAHTQISSTNVMSFKVFNQEIRSFKGVITWICLSTPKQSYLIDSLKLKPALTEILKSTFENKRILKIGIDIIKQLLYLQRDFNIFTVNVFDLKQLLLQQDYAFRLGTTMKQSILKIPHILREVFQESSPKAIKLSELHKRPIGEQYFAYISLHSSIIFRLLFNFSISFANCSPDLLVTEYRKSNQMTKNSYVHHETPFEKNLQEIVKYCKDNKENSGNINEKKIKRFLKWRLHMAKMKDQSLEYIIPIKIIKQIFARDVKSMLQLNLIYQEYSSKQLVYSVDYKHTILQVLNHKSESINPDKLREEVDNNSENPIKFFKSIGWTESDWKNNNFESMKLFKEIISMNKFDVSIIQPELAETEDRILSNEQLMCIFNYADAFANNQKELLQLHHQNLLKITKNPPKQDELQPKQLKPKDTNNQFKFPQSIEQIYKMANKKKKEMTKNKNKGKQEKDEVLNLNVKQFLRSINWS